MATLELIADERRRLADLLDTPRRRSSGDVQSLCGEWTVRDVAAHLTAG